MFTARTRARRIATISAAPVAVLVAGLLIWQSSNAAFTARTQSVGNNWATGSVSLTDDDLGAAAFSVQGVVPGQTGSRCITVTSTSSVPGVVKLYLTRMGLNGLQDYIYGSLETGAGGSFGSCTGFVAEAPATPFVPFSLFGASTYDYATGAAPWATAGNTAGESKTYKFTWVFDTTGLTQAQVDALQGKSISTDLIWELQSN
jgi:hypothetical protein